MNCRNHPAVAAVARCAGCAEPFCQNCVVNIGGQAYCGQCKVMATQGRPMGDVGTIPCKDADEALKYGIISIICLGFILGPIAISKALNAKKMIQMNPQLTGDGKATAAIVLGIIGTILHAVSLYLKVTQRI